MKECVIFCAAGFDGLAIPLTEEDYLIAADGGLRHTERLGVTPNAIIGDFDSLNYIPTGAEVFPVEKDDTDSMLAVKLGLSKGYDRFLIYGGLDGVRLDHTVANYQALQYLADRDARGILIGRDFCATVLHGAGCPGREYRRAVLFLKERNADLRLSPGGQQSFYGFGRPGQCGPGQPSDPLAAGSRPAGIRSVRRQRHG